MTTIIHNASTYGSDVLHYASLKGEQDSGPLFFYLTHSNTLNDLAAKVEYALSKDEKVRPVVLDHWKATPEGEAIMKEYAALLAIKQKTPEQEMRQRTLMDLQNQVNIQTLRNIDTCKGIDVLVGLDREVNVQRIQGTNKYACYVVSTLKNDDGTRKEFIHVTFTATQLRRLASAGNAVNVMMTTTDIRKVCDSLKTGTANKEKGGVDGLARTEIGKTAKALDAAISGSFVDGKLQGVSPATREQVMAFACMVYRETSETEWKAALAAYDALAAKPEVAKVVEAAKVVKPAKAKAKAA